MSEWTSGWCAFWLVEHWSVAVRRNGDNQFVKI
jgi:hypothetical protein